MTIHFDDVWGQAHVRVCARWARDQLEGREHDDSCRPWEPVEECEYGCGATYCSETCRDIDQENDGHARLCSQGNRYEILELLRSFWSGGPVSVEEQWQWDP